MVLSRICILILCVATAVSAADAQRQSVRLLAIGNSFSADILSQLPALAKAGGRTLEVQHCAFGGGRLEQHWGCVEAADAAPQDPRFLYEGKLSLRSALQLQAWDVVTLQQYSRISPDPATYRPYADKLVALIRASVPQAEIRFHQTWAYRIDDPRYVPDMHQKIRAAYRGVAADLGVGIIPVGDAFARVGADPVWGYLPDPAWNAATAVYPSIPPVQKNSLHGGWYWRMKDGQPVPDKDGVIKLACDHHASDLGDYLGACVWYGILFRASPVGVDYAPAGIPPEQRRFLQQTAWELADAELRGAAAP